MMSLSNGIPEPEQAALSAGALLRQIRMRKGWSQLRLVVAMEQVALARQESPPTRESLKAMVSRWENGHREPDEYNRRLLCAALGVAAAELGLTLDPDVPW